VSDEEYQIAQNMLILCARSLAEHDWTAFFNRIEHAETMGVFLIAPAEYQRATALTRHIGSMAVVARRLVNHLHELDAEAASKVAHS
jgi:predicted alpha/beta hydrolase family esterase